MEQKEILEMFKEIENKCAERMEMGRIKYGNLDLDDDRDFTEEAIEELYDCINYCKIQIVKLKNQQVWKNHKKR